jgi:hypothetical protein
VLIAVITITKTLDDHDANVYLQIDATSPNGHDVTVEEALKMLDDARRMILDDC